MQLLKRYRLVFSSLLVFCLIAFRDAPEQVTVYLIGDSTMSIKQTKAYPETGWGMPFVYFFDSSVKVDNRAMNGRSTQSFLDEKRWEPVVNSLKRGDYVFIQFGHNDEVPTKKVYTTPLQFTQNMEKYIAETRQHQAIPVLLTPVARRSFRDGRIKDTHVEYAALTRQVAAAQQVMLVDLDSLSMQLLQQFGPETSRLLFNHLRPGEHPNYPDGKADDTHFSELGARLMAELVLADIKRQQLPLADRIVKVKEKNKATVNP
jgi:lysophospholipase L1-like esterase